MIVKILKSSESFNAINYNATRVNKGEATLLDVKNMGSYGNVCQSIWDYKRFLEKWTNRNSRIKNGQLHLVISCKDKEYTPRELQNIAEKWLQEMGYGTNPTLFFFHKNTKNNHIHIITSRVDKDGKKVNDKFEKERSLKTIKSIMGEDLKHEMRNTIGKSLRYSYSSLKQFSMILEDLGYKVNTEENGLIIEKHGISTFVSKQLIEYAQKRYCKEYLSKDKYKNRAIFDKYSKKMNITEFKSFIRTNFGLSIVFFGKKDSPYGYAVIDHKNRMVIPGKEIIPIKQLLTNLSAPKDKVKNTDLCLDLIKIKLREDKYISEYQMNFYLQKYDVSVKNGVLTDKLSKQELGSLSTKEADTLKRNNRLAFIRNTYDPQTPMEYRFLCNKYKVEENDLRKMPATGSDKTQRNEKANLYKSLLIELSMSDNIKETLMKMDVRIIKGDEEFLVYDKDCDVLLSNKTLGLDYNMFENLESYGYYFIKKEDQNKDSGKLQDNISEFMDSIVDIAIPSSIDTSEDSQSRKRRRR